MQHGVRWVFPKSTERLLWGRRLIILPGRRPFPFHRGALTMKPEEQTEEEIILAFAVSDDALEFAASPNFSLGNCTEMPAYAPWMNDAARTIDEGMMHKVSRL